ncbi:universal stress protein [Haloarchaeobius amylolyticus]|uniref:universal stress protein n=1 Tax=Haloarchaeobius amylolyticus TaxID=1198296 RepID=UPI002271656F|nr:universal stress protein [Haloarchaeobius amylolyticus]
MAMDTVLLALGHEDEERLESITDTVVDLAAPGESTVVLGHVFTWEEYDDVKEKLDISKDAEVTPDDVAAKYNTVRTVAGLLAEAGVDYEIRGAVGEYGHEIVDLAEEETADLVVVGGRKRSPTGKAVFGSTAQEVMLNAPCPVTFVRSD